MSQDHTHSGGGPELLPPGFVVDERYRILSLLGKGGMGCVYRAADAVLGDEEVAIKILHPDFIHDQELMQRFLREVQLMRRVSHKNVVRTYDVGSDGNLAYFTMEYVPGRSLEVLLRENAVPRPKVASIVVQIAEALDAIHRAGVIHRDLKPGNVLILKDGTVRITDFGVARPEVSEMTAHNEILGSVCYIAPEIWLGQEPAPSVDLYSLGIILYEIATGDVPFDGGSPAELMRLHLDKAPVPPKELNPSTPPWLNSVILRLLEKKPQDRFASGIELANHVRLHLNEGNVKEKASKDAQSFLGELEEKSRTMQAITPEQERAAAVKAAAQVEARAVSAPKARQQLRVKKEDSSAQGRFLAERLLQLGRAVIFSSVLSSLAFLLGAGIRWLLPVADSSGTAILWLLSASVLLLITFSIPSFVLALSCKAWTSLLRATLTSVLLLLGIETAAFSLSFFSLPASESELASRILLAGQSAMEQVVATATLQPLALFPEDPANTARLIPLHQNALACISIVLLLIGIGFTLRNILGSRSTRSSLIAFGGIGLLGLLIFLESILVRAGQITSRIGIGIVDTGLPAEFLALGALHWMLLFVLGIFGRGLRK